MHVCKCYMLKLSFKCLCRLTYMLILKLINLVVFCKWDQTWTLINLLLTLDKKYRGVAMRRHLCMCFHIASAQKKQQKKTKT